MAPPPRKLNETRRRKPKGEPLSPEERVKHLCREFGSKVDRTAVEQAVASVHAKERSLVRDVIDAFKRPYDRRLGETKKLKQLARAAERMQDLLKAEELRIALYLFAYGDRNDEFDQWKAQLDQLKKYAERYAGLAKVEHGPLFDVLPPEPLKGKPPYAIVQPLAVVEAVRLLVHHGLPVTGRRKAPPGVPFLGRVAAILSGHEDAKLHHYVDKLIKAGTTSKMVRV